MMARPTPIRKWFRCGPINPATIAHPITGINGGRGLRPAAKRQRELIDFVDKMARANHEKANRSLALVYADQDRNLDRALELAEAELEVRGDVYTYDALAWVLFKT